MHQLGGKEINLPSKGLHDASTRGEYIYIYTYLPSKGLHDASTGDRRSVDDLSEAVYRWGCSVRLPPACVHGGARAYTPLFVRIHEALWFWCRTARSRWVPPTDRPLAPRHPSSLNKNANDIPQQRTGRVLSKQTTKTKKERTDQRTNERTNTFSESSRSRSLALARPALFCWGCFPSPAGWYVREARHLTPGAVKTHTHTNFVPD